MTDIQHNISSVLKLIVILVRVLAPNFAALPPNFAAKFCRQILPPNFAAKFCFNGSFTLSKSTILSFSKNNACCVCFGSLGDLTRRIVSIDCSKAQGTKASSKPDCCHWYFLRHESLNEGAYSEYIAGFWLRWLRAFKLSPNSSLKRSGREP